VGSSRQGASELRDDDELLELQAHSDHGPAEVGDVVLVRAPDLLDEIMRPEALTAPDINKLSVDYRPLCDAREIAKMVINCLVWNLSYLCPAR
jgi:hypothetical protein